MDIIDDYTSQLWSIPLKNKDDSFLELKAGELAHESQTGQKFGIYITDQVELKSDKMKEWLQSQGIEQHFTAPYMSAHIGHIERMHRTLSIRLCETWAECKKILQDIPEEEACNASEVIENAAIAELMEIFGPLNLGDIEGDHIDQALSAMSEMPQIDPSTLEFEDELRNWKEAKASADAKCWKEGYHDELKSLKEMGIYKLIPRSDVLQGHKIRKGMPIFRIKCDETGKAICWKVCLVFKGFEQIYSKDTPKQPHPQRAWSPGTYSFI